jgi:Zn-dependent peptidase ImmA (M78 family)/DNA-binding XRE family transcriptional regulator
MPPKGGTIEVTPSALQWARESAGVSPQELADKLGVTADVVQRWESGRQCPTLRNLERMASFFKRPLAVFFLPAPPEEPAFPHDFRVLPEEERQPLSRKTRLAVRRSQRLQRIAGDLEAAPGAAVQGTWSRATRRRDPEPLADSERDRLGVSLEEQAAAPSDSRAFTRWRWAVEDLGILVFQFPMPVEEARGFSLTGKAPPVIVVNSKDMPAARSFTLFHEYAHTMLDEGGICLWEEATPGAASPVERFCNHFAGALLVPATALREDESIARSHGAAALDDAALGAIARRFHVSRHVVWRRMLVLGLVSESAYRKRLASWRQRGVPGGRRLRFRAVEPARRCVRQRGHRFPEIVLEARQRDAITSRDVADYLSLDIQHLNRLQAILSGTGPE